MCKHCPTAPDHIIAAALQRIRQSIHALHSAADAHRAAGDHTKATEADAIAANVARIIRKAG